MFCSVDENPYKITNVERYRIIDKLSSEYPVGVLCDLLNTKYHTYRKWVREGKKHLLRFDTDIANLVSTEHYKQNETYGTDRLIKEIKRKYKLIKEIKRKYKLIKEIKRKYKLVLNHKRVRRIKQLLGLECCVRKVKKQYTNISKKQQQENCKYIYENKIKCNFHCEYPYQKLSTDVSYIKTKNGTVYLSAVKDLFDNSIIAHSISTSNDSKLILDTLKQLKYTRDCIIHSDQGSTYKSEDYYNATRQLGYVPSMSRKGCCWENSPIENWFSQLKEEHLRRIGLMTINETIEEIKKYVDWYNSQRIQKKLNYLSPDDFKQLYIANNIAICNY